MTINELVVTSGVIALGVVLVVLLIHILVRYESWMYSRLRMRK